MLIAAVGGTAIVGFLGLAASAGVPVVGPLPQGLPTFGIPAVSLEDLAAMAAGGLAIAVVSMADTSVLSRTLAASAGDRVDQNQELLALGVANAGAGLLPRLLHQRQRVADARGRAIRREDPAGRRRRGADDGRSARVRPGVTTNLPQAVLAAIVMTACLSLVDVRGVVRLWRLRRSEFALSIVCFAGVALVGVIQGIFLAVGAGARGAFIWRAWRPYSAILGRVDGLKGYHDLTRYPEARQVDGLILFRWDAPLFFANAERSGSRSRRPSTAPPRRRAGSSWPPSRSPRST